jgi:outer membrane protein OmpA-like peptidoglycan-associated protein
LTDGLNLTSNEQEVYDLIIENDIYMDKFVGAWNVLNNRERKYFLDSLSGSFLVNAMTMGAVFDNSAILALIKEGAIKNRETKFNKKEGMWIIGSYNSLKWSNSKQTLGDFNASGIGVKAGKDIVVFDWGLAGIFGGYENRNMSQSGNLANMDDAGAGIYGGFFIDIFSFNYTAQAAFQNIKTQREVRLENAYKPEAKIETYGIRGSAEIEINFEAQEMGIEYISPFAEYDFAQIENNTVSETGGESLNLTIYKDRYLRETIFGGIKIKPISDGRFSWNGKIYIGQVITGTKANKKISFMESGKMNIQGDEQEEIFYGGSIGIKYEASKKIDINFSFDIRGSENALAYRISAGMKYKFSVIMKKISSEKIKFEKKARAAISEKKKMNIKIDREAAGNIIADKIKTKEEIANQDKEKANEIKNAAKITYKLESALFKNASSELAQDMKIKLKTLADKIKKMDYKKIVIEGHTDSSGNDDKNRSLSIERAKAIYDELLKNGIPAEKMEYMGFGSNVPISSNDTAEGKAKNRRAEIFVL